MIAIMFQRSRPCNEDLAELAGERRMIRFATLAFVFVLPAIASAQHHAQPHGMPGGHGAGHGAASPYAGFQKREIKALSEAEHADLAAGRGMAMAVPAEMNGYPGPMHALELADRLGLSQEQRGELQQQMRNMREAAIEAGAKVVAAERRLDRLFVGGTANEETLAAAASLAGEARTQLRLVHLRTHLATRKTLTADQRAHYARLRGYSE
jgi:Spy/CpxP family protein refolding chaperone